MIQGKEVLNKKQINLVNQILFKINQKIHLENSISNRKKQEIHFKIKILSLKVSNKKYLHLNFNKK